MLRWFLFFSLSAICPHGKNVEYFIASVEENWNYNPAGKDSIDSSLLSPEITKPTIESVDYKKAMFKEYTDSTYSKVVDNDGYLGFLGPILRANVGDRIIVYFQNMATKPCSIHPHGLLYDKANEGSSYPGTTTTFPGSAVNPGAYFNYTWSVSASSGPTDTDPQCITSLYYSDVNMERDLNSGLLGMMIICKQDTPDNFTSGSLKEMLLFFGKIDERLSWYSDNRTDNSTAIKATINGYTFGQLPTREICQGHDILLHMTSLGGSHDVRSIKVYGHQLLHKGKRYDAVQLLPGASMTVQLKASEIGNWLLTSQREADIRDGMQGIISVKDCGLPRPLISISGIVRKYYIAAEKTKWNNGSQERPLSRISFVGYTDGTFMERIPRSQDDEYLGLIGPMITVEEGDFVKVIFLNKADRPLSLHPHGLRVGKPQEGVFYNDNSDGKQIVEPGELKTYYWTVPDYVSPTLMDNACITRYYTSGVGNSPDTDLLGPLVVCKQGMLDSDGKAISSERDIFLMFKTTSVKTGMSHEINGYSAGTLPTLDFCLGDNPTIHVIGYGTGEPQSIIISGNQVLKNGKTLSVVNLISEAVQTVPMKVTRNGTWEIRSTVYEELTANYQAEDCGKVLITEEFTKSKTTYLIGVSETNWNYFPRGDQNQWKSAQKSQVKMGSVYKKALFRRYYTTRFTHKVYGQSEILGPLIKSNIGDEITITFKNMASRPYSIYADGVISETEPKSEDNVDIIKWKIPESAGPGGGDPMCIIKPYFSSDNAKDLHSGLVGPLLICNKGTDHGSSSYKHYIVFLGVIDETQSWYFKENVEKYTTASDTIVRLDDPDLKASNLIHVVNGLTSGKVRNIVTDAGKEVFLHFANIGKEFHSIHIHGNYISDPTDPNEQKSIITLFPGETKSIKTMLNNTGTWIYEELSSEPHLTKFYGMITVQGDSRRPEK